MNANYLKVTLEISRNGVLGDWLVHLENLSFDKKNPIQMPFLNHKASQQEKAAQ